jgi:hypothetical protein
MTTYSLEVYRKVAADSSKWLEVGRRLLLSADALWDQSADYFKAMEEMIRLAELAEQQRGDRTGAIPVECRPELEQRFMKGTHHLPAFRLLSGYALENLLKGVHVRRRRLAGERVVTEDGKLFGIPKDHDLVVLAENVLGKSEVSTDDAFLLNRLSIATNWAGRYPVALANPSIDELYRAHGTLSDERETVHQFAARIIQTHDSLK